MLLTILHFSTHVQGSTVDFGPAFPNYLDEQISLQTDVIFDSVPFFRSFGDVTSDVGSSYGVVSCYYTIYRLQKNRVNAVYYKIECYVYVFQGDTVTVEFWAGNPRNNLMVKL